MIADLEKTPARELMTKNVHTIDSFAPIAEAAEKMREHNVSCLIVNRTNEADSYGIITRKDIVNKIVTADASVRGVIVSDIMSKPIITVWPDLSIKHCVAIMRLTGFRRLPVFDGEKIVGILSNTDVFNATY